MESSTEFNMPTLSAAGQELSDFVLEGWELIDSVELDFNEDGIADYVGVQEKAPDEGGVYGDPYEPLTAEGIELSQEMIKMPEEVYLHNYCNEDCVLYTLSNKEQDDKWKHYLAMYRWQDKSLTVLA